MSKIGQNRKGFAVRLRVASWRCVTSGMTLTLWASASASVSGRFIQTLPLGKHGGKQGDALSQHVTLPLPVGSLTGNLAQRGFDTCYRPPFFVTMSRHGHGTVRSWLRSSAECAPELSPHRGLSLTAASVTHCTATSNSRCPQESESEIHYYPSPCTVSSGRRLPGFHHVVMSVSPGNPVSLQ